MGELNDGFNVGGSAGKSFENTADVSTVLHGDDAELVLLINPHEESLLIVVEDTTAGGPVTVETDGFEETVAFPKKAVKFLNLT